MNALAGRYVLVLPFQPMAVTRLSSVASEASSVQRPMSSAGGRRPLVVDPIVVPARGIAVDPWPKKLSAITMFTEDLAATKRFYAEVFGVRQIFEDPQLGRSSSSGTR